MSSPNAGIPYVPEGTLDPAAGLNQAINVIDALLQSAVYSIALTAPPSGPADGSLYVVAGEGGTATGAWAGEERNLARYVEEGDFWEFYEAGSQAKIVLNREDFRVYAFDQTSSPGVWTLVSGGGLTIMDSDSPQLVQPDVTQIVFTGGVDLSVNSDGVLTVDVDSVGSGHAPLTALAIVSNVVTPACGWASTLELRMRRLSDG